MFGRPSMLPHSTPMKHCIRGDGCVLLGDSRVLTKEHLIQRPWIPQRGWGNR